MKKKTKLKVRRNADGDFVMSKHTAKQIIRSLRTLQITASYIGEICKNYMGEMHAQATDVWRVFDDAKGAEAEITRMLGK